MANQISKYDCNWPPGSRNEKTKYRGVMRALAKGADVNAVHRTPEAQRLVTQTEALSLSHNSGLHALCSISTLSSHDIGLATGQDSPLLS